MNLDEDAETATMIDEILRAESRAEEMTRSLMTFSRKQALQLSSVNLAAILEGLRKSLARLIREDIEISVQLAEESLPIMADKGQIEQVIINLAVNARDAMPHGGRLLINAEKVTVTGDKTGNDTGITKGQYALLSIVDSGHGMDNKTMALIFDPFFTTKEAGKGTGLGLSIVYGIIKKHNGTITVRSEPGNGTTFRIYLPLLEFSPDTIENSSEERCPGGDEKILVVDDDATIRQIMADTLTLHGYSVLLANNGEEGVRVFRAPSRKKSAWC